MRKIYLLFALILLTACSSVNKVVQTKDNMEYVVIGNITSPIGTVADAKEIAMIAASEFCNKMGKTYISIKTPICRGTFADSTLYFRCVEDELSKLRYSPDSVSRIHIIQPPQEFKYYSPEERQLFDTFVKNLLKAHPGMTLKEAEQQAYPLVYVKSLEMFD